MDKKYTRNSSTNRIRPSLSYMENNPVYKQQVLNTFGNTIASQLLVKLLLKDIEEGKKDRIKRIGSILNGYGAFNNEILNSNLRLRTKKFLIKNHFEFYRKLIFDYLTEENIKFSNHLNGYSNEVNLGNILLNVFYTKYKTYKKKLNDKDKLSF